MPGWRNGRRVGFRYQFRKEWEFESPPGHIMIYKQMTKPVDVRILTIMTLAFLWMPASHTADRMNEDMLESAIMLFIASNLSGLACNDTAVVKEHLAKYGAPTEAIRTSRLYPIWEMEWELEDGNNYVLHIRNESRDDAYSICSSRAGVSDN